MGYIRINIDAIKKLNSQANSIKNSLSYVEHRFNITRYAIDAEIMKRNSLYHRFQSVAMDLSRIEEHISNITRVVSKGAERYNNTEHKVVLMARNVKNRRPNIALKFEFGRGFVPIDIRRKIIYLDLITKPLQKKMMVFLEELSKSSVEIDTSSLYQYSNGSDTLDILGIESVEELNQLFGTTSSSIFIAKYSSENAEHSFFNIGAENESTLKFGTEKDNRSEFLQNWLDTVQEKLEDNDLYDEEEVTKYFDKYGNEIDEKDASTFYEKQGTVLEFDIENKISANIYESSFNLGNYGDLDITVGEVEAHGSIAAGLYVIGGNGEKIFSPGVNAEIGVSGTVLEVDWEKQLCGNEMLGLNADANVTVGKVEAKGEVTAQFFNQNGEIDAQFGISGSIEAIAVEAEGTIAANVLGGEIGVTGGVNFGIGAHADVGYSDGIFKVDVGASLGIGVSLDVEVDVGGMIDTAVAVWDNAQNAFEEFTHWWS